jgi:hypothetical protein
MSWLKRGLKHAFAVDPPGPAAPTVEQQAAVDWVCQQIAKRHLTTPGLIFLEMSRPMNAIGAALLHFAQPGAWAVMSKQSYDGYVQFSTFLEQRGSMEYLCRRIEHFEEQYQSAARQARRDAKAPRQEGPLD